MTFYANFLATIHNANPVLMCAWWNLYIQRINGCCCFLLFAVYGRHWLRHEKLSVFSRKQSFLSCLYSLRDCGLLLGCRANPFNARKLLAMPIGKKMISGFILISSKISAKKSRLQIGDLDVIVMPLDHFLFQSVLGQSLLVTTTCICIQQQAPTIRKVWSPAD